MPYLAFVVFTPRSFSGKGSAIARVEEVSAALLAEGNRASAVGDGGDGGGGEESLARRDDDFVLKQLFSHAGVHSALGHDEIVGNDEPEHLIVEYEGEA